MPVEDGAGGMREGSCEGSKHWQHPILSRHLSTCPALSDCQKPVLQNSCVCTLSCSTSSWNSMADCVIPVSFIRHKTFCSATFHASFLPPLPVSLTLSHSLPCSLSLSPLSLFWRRLLHISQAGRLRAWDFPTPHSKPLILCFGGNIKRRGIERQLLL